MLGVCLVCGPLISQCFNVKLTTDNSRLCAGRTWADMEILLKRIAWVDKLRTRVCKSVWARVEADNALVFYQQGMVDPSAQWLGATYSREVLDYEKSWNA